MEKIYRKIGQKVKRQRKALKWTQEQLAECADLSPQYLSRIERGVAAPTLETLYKLATVLQCSIHQLLPETQTPEKLIHFETAAAQNPNLSQEKLELLIKFLEWETSQDFD